MSKQLSDQEWFAANPQREFRLRPPFPGERLAVGKGFVAPNGWEVWAITRRVAPGVRAKASVCVDPVIAADAMGSESLVHAMFELLVAHPRSMTVPATTHEVVELAQKYAWEAKFNELERLANERNPVDRLLRTIH
jgi:hypothetical protein